MASSRARKPRQEKPREMAAAVPPAMVIETPDTGEGLFHRALFPSIFIFCAVVLFWYITDGNGRFAEQQWFTSYYDGVAESLLDGRLDVPAVYLDHEEFHHDGKSYGYFGPTPALPRIFLNAIFPEDRGQWTRTLIWLTAVATLFLNAALLSYCGFSLRSPLALVYFVTAALGSTLIFATSWAITYLEALSWATMLTIASIYCLLRYLREPSLRWLARASLAGGLGFFARASTGAGALFALSLVTACLWLRPAWLDPAAAPERDPRPAVKRPFSHRALPALALLVCFALYVTINYVKFGTILDSCPIRYHAYYSPELLAKIHGTLVHPEDAPRLLFDYVLGAPALRRSFPWFVFSNRNLLPIDWLLHKPLLAGSEVHAGVLATMPAMLLLGLLGVTVGLREHAYRVPLRLLLLPALTGVCVLVTLAWISQRYVHEFYPFVALSAPFGLRWLADRPPRERSRGFLVLAVLMVWSLAINPLLALHWQREGATWGCTQVCADQYKAIRASVDGWTGVAH